jgi:hypothetical protein
MGFPVKKRLEKACGEGKKRPWEILGKKRLWEQEIPVKKRLWEIFGKKRLREQGVPCEKEARERLLRGRLWKDFFFKEAGDPCIKKRLMLKKSARRNPCKKWPGKSPTQEA